MERKIKKIIVSILLTVSLIISSAIIPVNTTRKVQADKKAYCAGLKLNNNIKLNKTNIFTKKGIYQEATFYPEAEKIDVKYTVKCNRKSVGKNYKVSYTVKYKYMSDPKIKNADKIWYDDWWWGFTKPSVLYTVFDYQTGKSLEVKNKLGVKVKKVYWKDSAYPKQYYKYTGDLATEYKEEDCWFRNYKTINYSFTITYPKKCKDVVVGIGFTNCREVPKLEGVKKGVDEQYWTGKKIPYGKTSYYKKGKKTMSYMRLNK